MGLTSHDFGVDVCYDSLAFLGFTTTYKTRGDCQTTRKSYKTSHSVGWFVGWKKSFNVDFER